MGPEHRRGARIPHEVRGYPWVQLSRLAPEPAGGLGCRSPGSERRVGGRRCLDRWSASRSSPRTLLLTAQPLHVLRPIAPPAGGRSGPRRENSPFELSSLFLCGITDSLLVSILGPVPFARDLQRLVTAQAHGWEPSGAAPGTSAAGARARPPIFKGASLLSSFRSTSLRATSNFETKSWKNGSCLGSFPPSPAGGPVCEGGTPAWPRQPLDGRTAGLPQKPLRIGTEAGSLSCPDVRWERWPDVLAVQGLLERVGLCTGMGVPACRGEFGSRQVGRRL